VLVGATAGGKTGLAVDVAHALGSEIISADSRQVYRGLDLGSGKDLDEYARVTPPVPYHLIDVADPAEVYSVFHHQRDCYALLERKARESEYAAGKPLLMVGGSGLLVEAILRGYRIPNVPENVELRKELMQLDHDELIRRLEGEDGEFVERADLSSKKRVVRALELAHHAREHEVQYSPPPPVTIDYKAFVLDVPVETLGRRIDRRLDERMDAGMPDEVQGLLDRGISVARMNQLGLEYRELTAYLTGAKSREQMLDDLRRGIRKLAKRQRTWFRGMERRGIEATWIEADGAGTMTEWGRRS